MCDIGWEPLVVNLGHCYRKQQRWDDAVQVYERALGLCPGQAGTYAALGFTRHLKVTSPIVSEYDGSVPACFASTLGADEYITGLMGFMLQLTDVWAEACCKTVLGHCADNAIAVVKYFSKKSMGLQYLKF